MIRFDEVSKSYGGRSLLDGASFTMGSGERLALIGRNGTGKSTLFKLILGEEEADDGEIQIPRGYTVGHLAQHLEFSEENIVAEAMAGLPHDRADEEYKAEIILAGLGFSTSDMSRPASEFSGGFQIRINLARLLLAEPNMLLLDEPTNYLDIVSMRWLEEFLKQWPGEMIIISHDRDFLNQVATHTMIVHRKQLRRMRGNTADLYEQIAQDEERYEQTRVNEEKKRAQVEVFINRFRAKASKASQVQSRIKELERIGRKEELQDEDTLEFSFRETEEFHGKYLMEANEIGFGFQNGVQLIDRLSLTLSPGERIGLIGKNGRGKSTLLRLLVGELTPNSGKISLSAHTRIGYFGQTNIERLDRNLTIEREIERTNDRLSRTEVRSICGAMMFSGDDALKRVEVLSGGERSRVLLGKIIAQKTNLLLLDEPTNHLDMESIEALVAACQSYRGAVAIVTHSEYILRELVTKIIVFTNSGPVLVDGNYDYFLEMIGWEEDELDGLSKTIAKKPKVAQAPDKEDRKRYLALKKELSSIENQIIQLEKKRSLCEVQLDKATNVGDRGKITAESSSLGIIQKEIDLAYEQLGKVDAQLEEIKSRDEVN